MEKIIRKLTLAEGEDIYSTRLVKDFPACEVKPWERIKQLVNQGAYEMFGMLEESMLLAYGFVVKNPEESWVMMDYFAVSKSFRGKGYGQYFLRHLWELYPKISGVIFEVEDVSEAKNEQEKVMRERRIRFYQRAGLQLYSVYAKVYDADYQLMYYRREGNMPEPKALIEGYKKLYQVILGPEKLEKYVMIQAK